MLSAGESPKISPTTKRGGSGYTSITERSSRANANVSGRFAVYFARWNSLSGSYELATSFGDGGLSRKSAPFQYAKNMSRRKPSTPASSQ